MRSILFLAVVFSIAGNAQEMNPRFVRIAKIKGRAEILRYGLKEWEDAAINMILAEGDKIYTNRGSYVELQFDNGTIVRLNETTTIEIVDLGRDPETQEEISSVYVISGDIKVKVPRYYTSGKTFRVESPQGLFLIEEESSARINVNDKTEILLYKGRAKITSEKGETSLLKGEKVFIEKGTLSHPEKIKTIRGDYFDEWCIEEREESISSKYLPDEIVIGVDELDRYGRWVYVREYGWVWKPRVYFGWRPYFHGHWVFTCHWGWVWVSYEPWGWIPYHYGRWAYCWPYGWVWIPGCVWAPCWVVWCEGPDWIAWCPMGPDDGPWFHCSVHIGVRTKWIYVTKESFRRYKYKYCEKPYRSYKPYRYAYKRPRRMNDKWTKKAPKISPVYDIPKRKTTRMDILIPKEPRKRNIPTPAHKKSHKRDFPIPVYKKSHKKDIPIPVDKKSYKRDIPTPKHVLPSSKEKWFKTLFDRFFSYKEGKKFSTKREKFLYNDKEKGDSFHKKNVKAKSKRILRK